ncbi:hypothetical protein FSP39_019166 [Pinctada imbricata]|uniref:Deleted in malignant brain tumors 1 protein n=1 Tax=Pinctada imbricata TaxID=66713 RepID=A0AA88YLD9_PINIB|nr:hypothetical protein FSP39_019166 [Pinctada imbricata]
MFNSWGEHDCSDNEAVGVSCFENTQTPRPTCTPPVQTGGSTCLRQPDLSEPHVRSVSNNIANGSVRLKGPAQYSGIGCVEFYYNGAWGSVCDDFWGINNAKVICRQLGYDPNQARSGIPAMYDYFRQNVSTQIVLDDIKCNGNEARIDQCPHSPYDVTNCAVDERLCISCLSLYRFPPTSGITRLNIKEVEVSCVFPRNLVASRGLHPIQHTMTKSAAGRYQINMFFYLNNQFIVPVTRYPLNLTVGEWLNVALILQAVRTDLKLIVSTCVATPSTNRFDPEIYPLFIDKCARDETLTLVPLTATMFGFSFQSFKFCCLDVADIVYIHCDAVVCLQSEKTNQCERSCTHRNSSQIGRRRRRDNDDPSSFKDVYHLRSPPLRIHKQEGLDYILASQESASPKVLKRRRQGNDSNIDSDLITASTSLIAMSSQPKNNPNTYSRKKTTIRTSTTKLQYGTNLKSPDLTATLVKKKVDGTAHATTTTVPTKNVKTSYVETPDGMTSGVKTSDIKTQNIKAQDAKTSGYIKGDVFTTSVQASKIKTTVKKSTPASTTEAKPNYVIRTTQTEGAMVEDISSLIVATSNVKTANIKTTAFHSTELKTTDSKVPHVKTANTTDGKTPSSSTTLSKTADMKDTAKATSLTDKTKGIRDESVLNFDKLIVDGKKIIQTNETHIVYYNTIRYNFTDTSNVITRVYVTEVSVSCVFPRDLDANNVVNPLPHTVPMEAPGQYDINLLFFLDNSFEVPVLSTPVNLTIAEWLNAALTLEAVRTDSKLVVPNCVATPSTNQYDAVNYPLFIDKCERDSTLTFLPLNSTSFGFRYQTFMFPYHEMVYIHCDAIVCLQSEKTEQCDRSCSRQNTTGAGRRKRDTDVDSNREYYHLRSPPLRLRRQEGFNYVITDLNVTGQTPVRLVNGTTERSGALQVFYNGTWRAVCDDCFDVPEAWTICRMLNFTPILARAGVPAEYNHYRNGISPIIVLDDVQCHGNETRIDQCPGNQFGIHNCTANEKLCVSCQQAPEATPEIPAPLLQCNNGTISASFNRTFDSALAERHLSLASGICPYVTKSTDVNFVTMNIPFDRCNTGIKTNESHIVYYNTIRYNYTNTDEVIIRVRIIEVLVSCVFPRDLEASNGVRPLPQTVTKETTGRYNIRLQFFLNNQFQNPVPNTPLNLTLGEWLNAALTLEAVRSDLKLVVMHCEATPTTNQHNVINYPLFIDKCERDNTLTLVPLNSTSFGFRYQTFMFPYHEMVYIHCDALVCLQSEKTEQCDRSCNRPSTASTGRRRRDTEDDSVMLHKIYHLTSPALRLRQIEGYNYIITDLNVTELGILRRGKQLNNTGDNEDIGTTIHTTLQGETSKLHSTLSTTTTHQASVQSSKSDIIDDEERFNYDEPFVAGLSGFSRSYSQTLATSFIYIFSSFVVVVKTLFDI